MKSSWYLRCVESPSTVHFSRIFNRFIMCGNICYHGSRDITRRQGTVMLLQFDRKEVLHKYHHSKSLQYTAIVTVSLQLALFLDNVWAEWLCCQQVFFWASSLPSFFWQRPSWHSLLHQVISWAVSNRRGAVAVRQTKMTPTLYDNWSAVWEPSPPWEVNVWHGGLKIICVFDVPIN